jgi:ABC-2 type transport system ATP-binding protein
MRGMIQVKNIVKYFGPVLAVDHVSFEVGKGEIVGLLGPNGAGKTTTMRILTSFLPATSGVARVAGFDVMNQSLEVRQNIGYLPESVPLYPEMRVEEYLSYRAKLKGVERKERSKRIDDCLERCRLREVRRRLIGTLSKGYKQRVGLADALVHDPPILILDEPTSGLDPIQIKETLNTIRSLREKHTIILSTHILPEVEKTCERVIIINSGRIGLDKRLAELGKDTARIIVEARGPAERIAEVLRTTEDVVSVTSRPISDDLTAFEVTPKQEYQARGVVVADLREAIFQRIAKNGWVLRCLDLRFQGLEEMFNAVVHREQEEFLGRQRPADKPESGDGAETSSAFREKSA